MIIHTFFCIFFGTYYGSPDINDMSDADTDSEVSFEWDLCLEGSHDFKDDIDCILFSDLLRMVEQEWNLTSWGDNEDCDLKIACITEEMKHDLVELLQRVQRCLRIFISGYAWVSTDIVIW